MLQCLSPHNTTPRIPERFQRTSLVRNCSSITHRRPQLRLLRGSDSAAQEIASEKEHSLVVRQKLRYSDNTSQKWKDCISKKT